MDLPKPFQIYRHFKGNYYQILTIASHSETQEQMVVYQQLYSPYKTFVRPAQMFMSEVDHEKYPNAKQKYRFALQTSLPNAQNDGLYEEYKKKEDKVSEIENVSSKEVDETQIYSRTQSFHQKDDFKVSNFEDLLMKDEEQQSQQNEEELNLHPMLVKFLDADTYEEKLEILSNLHREITDEIINTMAVSLDLEVKDGDIEDRYREVMNCLVTLEKFECNRLR